MTLITAFEIGILLGLIPYFVLAWRVGVVRTPDERRE